MSNDTARKIKKAVITGATGTIGIALINECVRRNIEVIVLANPASKRIDRIKQNDLVRVIFCGLDELKGEKVAEKITKMTGSSIDVFFHLAWAGTFGSDRDNLELQQKNCEYALDAVRLAKSLGCHTFIGSGSQAEYGRVSGILKEDTPCNPENGYGVYKLKTGKETRKLCNELGLVHVWPRILSIYGPYDRSETMIMSTVSSLLAGNSPKLTKGEQMWDYLYCDDAARALVMMGEKGVSGRIYPLGSGKARQLKDYVEILHDYANPAIALSFGEVPYSPKQVMHLQADISQLTADTGFVPEISFEEGIRKTISWVRENIS